MNKLSRIKKISIILPAYNTGRTIRRCIDSVLSQSYDNFELIIINDGSTDNTLDILRRYAKQDKRIKVIDQNNQGPSAARNAGLQKASGDYVFFIDSDDSWELSLLSKVMAFLQEESLDIAIFGYSVDYFDTRTPSKSIVEEYQIIEKDDPSAVAVVKNKGMLGFGWNKAYKASLITKEMRFRSDIAYGEDVLFNAQVFKSANKIGFLDEVLYHYVQYDHQTLSKKYVSNLLELDILSNEAFSSILEAIKVPDNEVAQFFSQNTYARAKWSAYLISTTDQLGWADKEKQIKEILTHFNATVDLPRLSLGLMDKVMLPLFVRYNVRSIIYISNLRELIVKIKKSVK